jgi:lysophospholipase L1-like esterase
MTFRLNGVKGWIALVVAFVAGLAVAALVIVLVAAAGYAHWISPASQADPPENPFPSATSDFVVLGDSFASGEGARGFWSDSGTCHRSWQTYAYEIASEYKDGLVFPACSGAVISNLENANGPIPSQLSVLSAAPKPAAVLVQISGNDVGFGTLVESCIKATYHASSVPCSDNNLLTRLPAVETRLEQVYTMVKKDAHGAPVFVMGYPDPFGTTYCTASELTPGDFNYVSTVFIPKLDNMIQHAASDTGVHYVNLQSAFSGFGVCELPVGEAALNTVSYFSLLTRHDSFHPSAVGQLLMAIRIEGALRDYSVPPPTDVTGAAAGAAGPTAQSPPTTSSASPQRAATQPSVPVPSQSSATKPLVDSSPCQAGTPPTTTYPIPNSSPAIIVSGATPSSVVCYRANKGTWHQVTSTPQGGALLAVPTGVGSQVEVIMKDKLGSWSRDVYIRSKL